MFHNLQGCPISCNIFSGSGGVMAWLTHSILPWILLKQCCIWDKSQLAKSKNILTELVCSKPHCKTLWHLYVLGGLFLLLEPLCMSLRSVMFRCQVNNGSYFTPTLKKKEKKRQKHGLSSSYSQTNSTSQSFLQGREGNPSSDGDSQTQPSPF